MSYLLGARIKANLMAGLPTRSKSEGDYTGEKIPPSGDYVNTTNPRSIIRPPWLPKPASSGTAPISYRSVA